MLKDQVVEAILEVVKTCVDNLTLPTGKTLLPAFMYSFIIFVLSGLLSLFNLLTFVRWQGALIATILLGCLCYIERRGENEISRLYRTFKSGVKNIKRGRTCSDSNKQDDGASNDSSSGEQESGELG